jgi:exosortase
VITSALFVALYYQTAIDLAIDWWTLPEAGHGLLLAPVAVWFAWKSGIRQGAKANIALGSAMLLFAIAVRCAAGLAADVFSTRVSMIMVLAGLTTYRYGFRQLLHWWLPFVLAGLAIPLPELVTQAIALPLQFRASRMGAALLQMRDVPVHLSGNIIRIPGHELFVTEACSGLRSLTALLSVGVLMGAVALSTLVARVSLLLIAIPIAIVVNGVRVFLTGFLVFFVSPALGQGFMHITEGWLLFLVSLGSLAIAATVGRWIEVRVQSRLRHSNV